MYNNNCTHTFDNRSIINLNNVNYKFLNIYLVYSKYELFVVVCYVIELLIKTINVYSLRNIYIAV